MKAFSYDFWKTDRSQDNITIYDNDFAKIVGIDEAVFIRRIIFFWEKWGRKNKNGVFLRPEKFTGQIGMTNYIFRKITTKWEEQGILKTKVVGRARKKYFKVNEKKLAEYLTMLFKKAHKNQKMQIAKSKSANCENEISYISKRIVNKRSEINSHCPSQSSQSAPRTSKTRSDRRVRDPIQYNDNMPSLIPNVSRPKKSKSYILAKKLSVVLQRHRKLTREPNLSKWTKQIEGLHYGPANASYEEISEMIELLDANIHDRYCPKPRCAEKFVECYPGLLDFQERMKNQSSPQNSQAEISPSPEKSQFCKKNLRPGEECLDCKQDNIPVYNVEEADCTHILLCKKCWRARQRKYREEDDAESLD